MNIKETFAQQFGRISQRANKAGFEIRFNAIQRGLLTRMNKEIGEVNEDGIKRQVAEVEKQRDKVAEKANRLLDLQFDVKTNALRFLDVRDQALAAINTADADEDGSLSEDEVTALNEKIGNLKEEVYKLKFTHQYPEFTDGNLANRMRQQVAALAEMTAVAGVIDAEGAPATNDNRAILDTLQTISSQANTYADSSTVLVGGLNQMITDANKKALDLEADAAGLTSGELARRAEEIADLQDRYGNLIKMISLSFEVQSGLADGLANGTQFKPEKGSILNIFS